MDSVSIRVCEYLKNPNPKGALLICGDWGAGKSHYINTKKGLIEGESAKKFIVVSLAGLKSRAEIDRAIFAASAPALFSGYASAANVFLKAGLRFVRIDPEDFKFDASLKPGEIVVVLEDFDRFDGKSEIPAGLVIDLVDQNRVHTIVVADDEKLREKSGDFAFWQEKVIAHAIRIRPEISVHFAELRNGLASTFARERIAQHESALLAITKNWGMSNLRILEYAINELAQILDHCGSALAELGEWEEIFLSGLFLGMLEVRRDARQKSVISAIFSKEGLSDAAQARLAGMTGEPLAEGQSSELKLVESMISRYESFKFSLFPGGEVFGEFFDYGVVDASRMMLAFGRLMQRKTPRQLFIENYFQLSQREFDEEYQSIYDDLANGRINNLGMIAKTFSAMQFMIHRSALALTEEDLKELVVGAVKAVEPEKVEDPEETDDFVYVARSDIATIAVKEAVDEKRKESRAWATEAARLSVFRGRGGGKFAANLRDWQLKPLFVGDAKELVEALESLSPSEVQDVIRLFGYRKRVSNYRNYLGDEKDTLKVVAERLRRSPPEGGHLSIIDSQLNALSEVMGEFAGSLDFQSQ